MSEHAPSQRRIAQALGLSQATVSRALRDDRCISPQQRARIQQEAERQGYRLSPLLSAAASRRFQDRQTARRCLVALVRWRPASGQARRLIAQFERLCAERGMQLLAVPARRRDPYRLSQELYRRGVSAVVFSDTDHDPDCLDGFDWQPFVLASFSRTLAHLPMAHFRPDKFQTTLDAYRHLWRSGYRRIGACLLRHDPEHPEDSAQWAAVWQAQYGCSGRHDPEAVCACGGGIPFSAIGAWCRRWRPDAVLGFTPGVGPAMPAGGPGSGACFLSLSQAGRGVLGFREDWLRLQTLAVDHLEQAIRYRRTGLLSAPHCTGVPGIWCDQGAAGGAASSVSACSPGGGP
ncbi:MAG: hypothetical protein ACOCXJ_05585 [Planctomycetota bacterium]